MLSLKNVPTANCLDTLFAYADGDMQNAIALVKADAMNTYGVYGNELSLCNEVRYILNLNAGNGYTIAVDVKYKVLGNDRVRASIIFDGNESIEDNNFDNYKYFSLNCSSESCKIPDIYDSASGSFKQAVDENCR